MSATVLPMNTKFCTLTHKYLFTLLTGRTVTSSSL